MYANDTQIFPHKYQLGTVLYFDPRNIMIGCILDASISRT